MTESEILPEITFKMLFEFVNKFNHALDIDEPVEKESSGLLNMIHIVREGNICKVISRIGANKYSSDTVAISVDELDEEEEIINCYCSKCKSSRKNICKHCISLLYFVCNETESKRHLRRLSWNWKEQWEKLLKDMGELFRHSSEYDLASVSMEAIINDFLHGEESFLSCAEQRMSQAICDRISEMTTSQSDSPLWFQLRRGRITASIFHEAAQCQTFDGSLVARILGEYSIPDTPAMQRGRRLENQVLETLGIAYRRIGLVLRPDYPEFGASPDAITEEFVIEVKCPTSEESITRYYFKEPGKLRKKCYAQVQLQMLMTGRKKGLFCVASPNFETTRECTRVYVDFDPNYCQKMVYKARLFWENAVFGKLLL